MPPEDPTPTPAPAGGGTDNTPAPDPASNPTPDPAPAGGGNGDGGTPTANPTPAGGSPGSLLDPSGGNKGDPDPTPAGGGKEAGENGEQWYNKLPEDVLNLEGAESILGKYSSEAEALKAAVHAQKQLGKKGLPLPDENAAPEEWSQVYNALGRPEDPSGYDWKPPEGITIDDEAFKQASEKLHGAGLNKEQFQMVMDQYAEDVRRMGEYQAQAQADQMAQTEQELRQEWGGNYETYLEQAQQVVQQEGLLDSFKQSGLANDAGVLRFLQRVAATRTEGKIHGNTPSVTDAASQIEELKQHPAYKDKAHPEHRKIVEKVVGLRGNL